MNLKTNNDKLFAKIIRHYYNDSNKCYTCDRYGNFSMLNMQVGHFVKRWNSFTSCHFDNVRPQCPICNITNDGEFDIFESNLRLEIGDIEVEYLIAMSKMSTGAEPNRYKNRAMKEILKEIKRNSISREEIKNILKWEDLKL